MIQVCLEWGDEWAHGKFQDAYECAQWAHRVGVRVLEWAHGKFQDDYESVRSGHTEWVCECLSGHTASFRMPMRVCAVRTQSGCLNARVSRFHGKEASGATRVGVRMLEWAGSTAKKRVVPREWAHGGCAYA